MISYMSVGIIKQNLWIVYLVLGILGAIGGIIYVWHIIEQYWWQILIILGAILLISKYYRKKISPRLHRWYEAIKSKMSKRVPREELENIMKEIEKVKSAIEEVKFKPEIKALTPEERKKLSISCNPIKAFIPPGIEFKFEMDNRFDQSFLLDRILYKALAGDIKRKYYICEDACLDRVEIKGNNKTTVSKLSLVANPDSVERINGYAIRGEHDIEWDISIEVFFEGSEGVKLLSETIPATTKYSDWKKWYKMWKEYENEGYIIKP